MQRGRIENIIEPFLIKFEKRDVLQVIIGSAILAIPVGMTAEVWELGQNLPVLNILSLLIIALTFILMFTYYHYHHHKTKEKVKGKEFWKRVISTYLISLLIVCLILTLIQKTPWITDPVLAVKRAVIVSLPASLGATIADTIK